jgi:hypothetical protein
MKKVLKAATRVKAVKTAKKTVKKSGPLLGDLIREAEGKNDKKAVQRAKNAGAVKAAAGIPAGAPIHKVLTRSDEGQTPLDKALRFAEGAIMDRGHREEHTTPDPYEQDSGLASSEDPHGVLSAHPGIVRDLENLAREKRAQSSNGRVTTNLEPLVHMALGNDH